MGKQLNGRSNAVQKRQTRSSRSTYRLIRSTDYSPLNGLNGVLNGSDFFERHSNGRSAVCPPLVRSHIEDVLS